MASPSDFPPDHPQPSPLHLLISCVSSSHPRPSAADKLHVPELSLATRLPASPTAQRLSETVWVPLQETLCLIQHLCPSFHLCLPQAPQDSHTSCFLCFPWGCPPHPFSAPHIRGSLPSSWEALTGLRSPKPPVVPSPLGPQTLPTLCFSDPVRANLWCRSCSSTRHDMFFK